MLPVRSAAAPPKAVTAAKAPAAAAPQHAEAEKAPHTHDAPAIMEHVKKKAAVKGKS